ncbi:hypothetical protein DFQ27_003236 [Actinomortierella ambigua]|uniref:SH3 domain-containing protein n=1 Tax=Actinomortierella ambigua TaxID=1343610 RepID=A0A9P6U552_9FUNG|nr:hypothetical protein DFQ27_003236 [Actinomortierella ambigua]
MSLKGTKTCPGYDAYQVDIKGGIEALKNFGISMPTFTNVETFDQAVLNATTFVGDQELCSAYNSSVRVRYQNTLLCTSITNADASRSCLSGSQYPPALCKSSCEAYATALSDMVKVTCPSDSQSAEAASYVSSVCSASSGWDSMRSTNNATCVNAVTSEANTCGFGTSQLMCDFCKQNLSDSCCTTNAAACPQNTPTQTGGPVSTTILLPPTSSPSNGGKGSNKDSNSDTGLSTAAIAGIAGGGVGLVVLIALIFVCMRRSRRASPAKGNLSRNISNGSGKYSISAPKLQEEGFSNIQIPMSTLPPVSKESAAAAAAMGPIAAGAAGAGAGAAAAAAAGSESSKPSFCQAIYPYQASMADELDLSPGDIINVHRVFDDGWAVGTNLNTSAEGAFPVVCVTAVDENALDDDFEEVNMAAMTPMTLREEDHEGRRSPSGRNSPRSSLPSRPSSPVHLPRRNSSIRDSAVIPTGTSPLTSSPLAGGSSGGKLTPPIRDTMMSEASSINRWWDGEKQ